jgi:hypothetical protein
MSSLKLKPLGVPEWPRRLVLHYNILIEQELSVDAITQASDAQPRYLIRNDNTGKETAYKVENILGRA